MKNAKSEDYMATFCDLWRFRGGFKGRVCLIVILKLRVFDFD